MRFNNSTAITETRKRGRQLHLLQLSTSNGRITFRSSLHLLFSLWIELSRANSVLASHEGSRISLDFILRSHDKIWKDLFQKRLFVVDLLWLATYNREKRKLLLGLLIFWRCFLKMIARAAMCLRLNWTIDGFCYFCSSTFGSNWKASKIIFFANQLIDWQDWSNDVTGWCYHSVKMRVCSPSAGVSRE